MKILVVSHLALPHLGGIEVAIDELATELTRQGHDVVHASGLSRAELEQEQSMVRPYTFVRLPSWNPLERRFGVPIPLHPPLALTRILRREIARADVVHCHGILQQSALFGLFLARGKRPTVLTEHVAHVPYANPLIDAVESLAIATMGRTAARLADALITFNSRVTKEVQRLAPRTPMFHVENGVDSTKFRPPSDGERRELRARLGWDERPRVLFVGRLVDKKGPGLAVQAAALGGFELVLVGPGDPPPAAREQPNVTVLGPLDPKQMPEMYRAADAFLLPSHGEGFPLTAQEAMASGLPTILGRDDGYAQTLRGAERGCRLVELDPSAIARAVNELLDDRSAASAAAAAFARERFSWGESARRHVAIYEQLLRERA